jgi:TPR repeat protein
MKRLLFCIFTALLLNVDTTWADPFEDGLAAFNRGDYAEALKWYRLSAAQGYADAQFALGLMYNAGYGVAQDYAEAIKWYRLAAAQGYADEQFALGLMYDLGQGVAQNYVRAYTWWNIIAATGYAREVEHRDIVAKKMTSQQIAEAQKLAIECQQKKFKGCD